MENRPSIEPKRIVLLFFMAATVLVGLFLERLLGIVFSYARWNDVSVFGGWTITTLVGFGIAVAAAVIAWRNAKLQSLSMEIAQELKRVTWPTMAETRAATMAVVAATFAAAVLLGFFDYVWAKLSDLIY